MLEDVLASARVNRKRNLSDLLALLRQPSIACENHGMTECIELLGKMMRDAGLTVDHLTVPDSQPVVFGELNVGAPQTLMFYDHYDVQPVEPLSEWDSPPFEPTIREGRIYARGVADNKGNLVARLKAIQAWMETVGRPPVNVKVFAEGEEEIGSPHLPDLLSRHAGRLEADGVVWETGRKDPLGRMEVNLGCKGILFVELTAHGARIDVHSGQAAIIGNPAWRLVDALRSMKDTETERITIEGFYDDVVAPSEHELALLRQHPLAEDKLKALWGIQGFINGYTGLDLTRRLFCEPTCTICGLTSGYTGPGSKTVVPRSAMARIDFRLVPDQSGDDIAGKIRAHLDRHGFADIELTYRATDPGQTPVDDPLVQVVADTAFETYGVPPVIRPRMVGSGPIVLFNRNLGLPTVSGVGIAYHGSMVHGANENCYVDDYYSGIDHVIRVLDRFAAS